MTITNKSQQSQLNDTLNALIIESIQEKKGTNILTLDLRKIPEAPADFFIICQGGSTTQVEAIAGNIYKRCNEEIEEIPHKIEGMRAGRWVIVDYFNTVVHVFHPESRTFYNLESLWNDASITEHDDNI